MSTATIQSLTDPILADHAARKDASGTTWFTAADLARLGIDMALMSCMQNVQHTLRLRRSGHVVETQGRTDAFSIQDAH
jgi:hypothetical protein